MPEPIGENTDRTRSDPGALRRGCRWLPWGLVAALTALVLWQSFGRPTIRLPEALAQNPSVAGARGIFAFTGQLDSDRYGLFMIDIEQGTIWVYELEGGGGARKLRLAAARTWLYDRYLKDFNCAAPSFREVQELVTRERAQLTAQRNSDPAAPELTGPQPATARERPAAPGPPALDPTKLPGAGGG